MSALGSLASAPTNERHVPGGAPPIGTSAEARAANAARRRITAAIIDSLPLAEIDGAIRIGRAEFDELAQASVAQLRRIAVRIIVCTRAILRCNSELRAAKPVRDLRQVIDRLASELCRDLPAVDLCLPARAGIRRESAYRESVLRHVAHQATLPASNFDRVCASLAERGLVGTYEFLNDAKTVARFRYSRSVTTDRVVSSDTYRTRKNHVESVNQFWNRVRTDEHVSTKYDLETTEELVTREHTIVDPRLNPVDAPIEQPAHVTELIRSLPQPYRAGLSLVTGTLIDFNEQVEESQRRNHTVRCDHVQKGQASIELTELGRRREREREAERRRRAVRRDPCVVFGHWCLVGWLPDSYDVSRFLDY